MKYYKKSKTFFDVTDGTKWVMALETGKTEKVSNLAYITPFLSLVWTHLFLNEAIKLNSLVGLIIIIFGILIQMKEKE